MDIKKIVNSPLINKSALAKKLWPGNKSPKQHLYNKLNNKGGQTFTPVDRNKCLEIFKDLFGD